MFTAIVLIRTRVIREESELFRWKCVILEIHVHLYLFCYMSDKEHLKS